jgi:putative ABC transport system permease protein
MPSFLDGFRLPFCFLRTNYGRLALTIGALAAGVALVCAIGLVNRSVLRAFNDVIDTMAGRAALQISAGNAGFFPEEVADVVGAVPGVELAVQTVGATAFLADGSGELLSVHGVDITNDAAVRVYEASDSHGTRLKDPLTFLNQPDSVMLTNEFARRRHLQVGDGVELETPVGRQRFVIRGLLEPQGIARVHGGNLMVMDLFAAEVTFTSPGLINRLDVVVRRDADVNQVQAAIAAAIPTGLTVAPPAQRKADLQKVMQSMQLVLQGVGLFALSAAFLIAFNRLATVFEERSWQHAVMRAVGVRRRGVWWELMKEGLVIGGCGVVLGVPLGIGLAHVLLPVFATTTALNSKLLAPRAEVVLNGWSLALAIGLGLVAALLAAARPAWRAAQVEVSESLRGRGTEHPESHRFMWMVRVIVWVGTIGAIAVQSMGGSAAWGLAATAGILVGVAIAARPLLDAVSRPLTQVAGRYMASGFFAAVALTRKPGRTALTIATLAVGFATVVWIWIVAQSFERSVVNVVHGVLRGDLAIGSAHSSNGFVPDPIEDAIIEELRRTPGVAAVVGEQVVDWNYANGPVAINAFDAAYVTSGVFGDWPLVGSSLPDLAEGFAAGTTAIISTNFALHLDARVGDTITLDTPSGPLALRVGGVISTLLSPRGTVIMSREAYKRSWHDPHIIHALVRTSGGDIDAVRSAIAGKLGQTYNLTILTLGEFAEWSAAQVEQAFAGLYVLAGLILFVVVFGAADTLAAGVLERQRELAVVRATGVQARKLQRIVLIEATLLAVMGLALAYGAGLALGVFWVQTMLPSMLGWVLELHLPYRHLATIGVVSLLVCIGAALGPARWARRLLPATALRYE